jgi:hypothetical protein
MYLSLDESVELEIGIGKILGRDESVTTGSDPRGDPAADDELEEKRRYYLYCGSGVTSGGRFITFDQMSN